MRAQFRTGARLKARLLPQVFKADLVVLNNEATFGPNGPRVRVRMDRVLAFGHGIASRLALLSDVGPVRRRQVSDVCALFNLGISLFDLVYDEFPAMRTDLMLMVSVDYLARMLSHPASTSRVGRIGNDVAELRILRRIVEWVLRKAARLANRKGDLVKLVELLQQALNAETGSFTGAGARIAARDRSVLPFRVIAHLVVAASSSGQPQSLIDGLGSRLGSIFAEVDDICDLVDDARGGSSNALLLKQGADPAWQPASPAYYGVLCSILDDRVVESAAERIASDLDALVADLACTQEPKEDGRFRNFTLAYLRNWLE